MKTYSLTQLVTYFLKLGTTGFGGPIALVNYMHRDLVEQRQWIHEDDYKEGLALAQLAPGPLAAQLAIYIGFIRYRVLGATLAGIAFVIPSFIMVVGLGYAYIKFSGLAWLQSIFYGVGAAVIGIIFISSIKLTRKTIGKDWLMWAIFLVTGIVTAIFEKEISWLMIASGVVVWIYRMKPWLGSVHTFLFPIFLQSAWFNTTTADLAWTFLKAGAFVFGSGLAIVPFLYGSVVHDHHWLTETQFMDAVAVAMITPGPVVITVGFIGFLIAGLPGACIAALATFLPCYLFTIIPAPYFKRFGKHPGLKAFIDGVTASAIGAIAGAVIVLAKRQLIDLISIMIALITAALLWNFKKLPEPIIILMAAIAGFVFR